MTANGPRPTIYLDYQSTTPTDRRVLAVMEPYFTEAFGNPHSRGHALGRQAAEAVNRARAQVATSIGADSREIVFTSGATESNNLALKGAAAFQREHAPNPRSHVVTLATEHKCVLEAARRIEAQGFEVTHVPVSESGLVDLDALSEAIGPRTFLVSVMAANNEIGVIQPVAGIGALCRARGVHFHTDAAQAAGKIALDVNAMSIDLMSISGHKVYGPKGIGALYVRRRPRVRLVPLIDGGGQERGLRSGTLPTPLCVGLGAALELAAGEREEESTRISELRDRFLAAITERIPDVLVNGDPARRLPGNLNLAFPGADGVALVGALPDVAISTGSACTSAFVEPSYVLRAIGLPADRAEASIRVGFGRFTTAAEVDCAAARIAEEVARQRAAATSGRRAASS
ncbi:MAG: aminotransferase class V-fold PLP-dependent enzyme [Rhodospirillales bacterium]|jgi:cysteine desulfurase|nr:aminotransferase class V-fold PLP-dependent enzyme [Rhodospirillales bacterium]